MTREEKVNAIMEFMVASEEEEILISVAGKQLEENKFEFQIIGVKEENALVPLFSFEAESPEAAKSEFESILEDATTLAKTLAASLQDYDA
jgi:hypothetical protein